MIRYRLRKLLFEAWQESIKHDYVTKRINSEHSLQASFWAQLNKRLPARSWRLFIEPDFRLPSQKKKKSVKPDLLITNSNSIVCVIELKYQPNTKPTKDKDLETLRYLSSYSKRLSYTNNRFRGESTKKVTYQFSEQTLFVWAGVHRLNKKSGSLINRKSFAEGIESMAGCYLELHAETITNRSPIIFKKNH